MKAVRYSLKVWLTGVFISPLIIVIFFGVHNKMSLNEAFFMLVAGIILGFLFSIPSFILFGVATYLVINKYLKWGSKKVMLSFFGTALTVLAFSIYGQQGLPRYEACLIAVYSSVIVTSVWLFKLKKRKPKNIRGNNYY